MNAESGVGSIEIERMDARRRGNTQNLLKGEVRKIGTYEDVVNAFRKADKNGDRCLSMSELHRLMRGLNKNWTEMHTHNLFRSVDRDADGELTIEEFLGFVFSSDVGTTGSAAETPYEAILRAFSQADSNRNGVLDKREFHRLMMKLRPNQWTAQCTNEVFDQVDSDRSGEVDTSELIQHIFGANNDGGGQSRKLIIQFVYGSGSNEARIIDIVEARWKARYKNKIKVRRKMDPDLPGILNVTATSPQHVEFWNKASMVAYRENPFATEQSIYAWADEMMTRHFPVLIGH